MIDGLKPLFIENDHFGHFGPFLQIWTEMVRFGQNGQKWSFWANNGLKTSIVLLEFVLDTPGTQFM